MVAVFLTLAAGVWSCNSSSQGGASAGGNGGGTGAGGSGAGGANAGGTGGAGAGGAGMGGKGAGGAGTAGQTGAGGNSQGGASGVVNCTPGVAATLVTDCGYPQASSLPLTSVEFNESEVLRAIEGAGGAPTATLKVFYSDEHALTLGVRQVIVTSATGMMTMDYPVSPLTGNPGSATDPMTGTNELAGPQSGLDVSQRPMWPVLYITDVTNDPNDRSGDWQHGGRPHNPNAIFGTWKAAVRTVDARVTPNKITITPDPDPMKNMWNLGPGADPVPMGLKGEGFSAEVRWIVPLQAGHNYRVQAIVHDGDQNKTGGDSGEACVLFCAGGSGPVGPNPDGGAPPPPACPNGAPACGEGAIDPVKCPMATVCANGCCLPVIP